MTARSLRRLLIAYSSKPPILDYLGGAFARRGIETFLLRADENTVFDKYVIHRVNKLAHSLRLLPKSRCLFEGHPLSHRNYRSARLLAAYREFEPDLVLVIRGIGFRREVLEATRPLLGWWVEHEGRVGEALAEAGCYDGYLFMNEAGVVAALAKGYEGAGFLAHAVDPHAFRRLEGESKRYDACFVGNWSEKRQAFIEAALEVTPNLALYGGKWLRKCWNRPKILRCWKGSYVEGEELNRLYNRTRVVLNITNWGKGEGRARSGMNMRVLEVPATGAFLLTDQSREMDSFLTPGTHVGIFDDLTEFGDQLRYYLTHEAEREAVAAAGYEHVRDRHTYDHMAEQIVAWYDGWRSGREAK